MFYLIGLGLSVNSISVEALWVLKNCKKIYLDNYTVELPYEIERLIDAVKEKIIPLTRIMIEKEDFVDEAKEQDIALLVYGSPLVATTHISLILKCKKEGIEHRVLHNASILDAVSETGLQNYKFGKTASMPKWQKNYEPDSFVDLIKDNLRIKAHSLLLVDIGLTYSDALKQLIMACERKQLNLVKIIVCSKIGINGGVMFYNTLHELAGKEVYPPFCFIIPAKLHFLEQEFLEKYSETLK